VPVVVIGVGNEFRRDDGAGLAVIERLRGLVPRGVELVITDGEPTRLIEAWTGAALAVVVDAVRAEPPHPGRVHRFVVHRPASGAGRPASSHGFGLDDSVALALALDRMPCRLIVHAIEAADLSQGAGLTAPVAAAVGLAAAAILADINAVITPGLGPSPAGWPGSGSPAGSAAADPRLPSPASSASGPTCPPGRMARTSRPSGLGFSFIGEQAGKT
jgi:hydrogenase maturation protease